MPVRYTSVAVYEKRKTYMRGWMARRRAKALTDKAKAADKPE